MECAITLDKSTAPNRFAIARKYGQLAAFGLLLCGLYLTSRYSYLLFHSLGPVDIQ